MRNFKAGGTHKVILSGSGLQIVDFQHIDYSWFNILELKNNSEEGVKFVCAIKAESFITNGSKVTASTIGLMTWSLTDNMVFYDNLSISGSTVNLNGHDMTINGNLNLNGNINLNKCKLTVNGDLIQTGGTLNINEGQLVVSGDYKIDNNGSNPYANLQMTNDADYILVQGDFLTNSYNDHSSLLTAGILEIKGNFTQRAYYNYFYPQYMRNFKAGGTHKVILSGSSLQTVDFRYPDYSRFNILVITKPLDTGYSFNVKPIWNTLIQEAADIEPPTVPAGLTVTARTGSSVSLAWAPSTDNVRMSGYEIYRDGVKINSVYGTTFTDTGLKPDTAYMYTVKAFDVSGNLSEPSEPVIATTAADDQPPTAPQGLTASNVTDSGVSLTWAESTDNAGVAGYSIYNGSTVVEAVYGTSHTLTGLNPNTSYSFTVRAFDAAGNLSGPSNTITVKTAADTQPPSIPQNVTASAVSLTGVTVVWEASADNIAVTGYEIYRDGVKAGTSTATTYADSGLKPNTAYSYTVKAFDAAGNKSAESAPFSVTTMLDTEAPGKPENLSISAGTGSTVTLGWTASGDNIGVAGYEIYRNGAKAGTSTTTTYTDNLTEQGTFTYTVKAFDAAGNYSNESNSVVYDNKAPDVPQNLRAISKTTTSVVLTWDIPNDNIGVTGYEIYRDEVKIKNVNTNIFTDTGLVFGTTYSYTIKACDGSGNISEASEELSITTANDTQPPSMPVNVIILSKTGTSVTLSWSPSTDDTGVAGYEIYRDGAKVGTSTITTYKDSGLTAGTTYKYQVRAYDSSTNFSAFSTQISTIPLVPRITGVNPPNGVTLGGSGSQTVYLYFANSGNREGARAAVEFSREGTEWIPVNADTNGPYVLDSNTLYFQTTCNLALLESGTYSVRCAVYDADDNFDQMTVTYQIDKNGPSAPQNLTAQATAGRISLAWEPSPEASVSGYKIYRSSQADGQYSLIGQVNGRTTVTYTDSSVTVDQPYFYKVTAVDKYGQESMPSGIAAGSPEPDTTAPVVLGIEPLDGSILGSSARITVRAQDNLLLSRIKLQYSVVERVYSVTDTVYSGQEETSWMDIATITTAGNATFDWNTSGLSGEVMVRAIAIDSAGNESDGNPIRTYTIKTEAPSKVTGLTATIYTTSAVLKWNDVPDQDFAYFQVERKTSENGEYTGIGRVNDRLGMNVTGLAANAIYWFRVVAYDTYGNRGIPSEELQVVTGADTTAPVVTSLDPKPGRFASVIPFKATVSDNIGVASVTFQLSGNARDWTDALTTTASSIQTTASFSYNVDVSNAAEGAIFVRAVARDTSGNTSNTTDTAPFVQYFIDHTAPAAPTGATAVPSSGDILVQWPQGTESDLAYYRVYKAQAADGTYTLAGDRLNTLWYRDRSVSQGEESFYKVSAVDQAGNESPRSGTISGKLLPDAEVPKIISISPSAGSTLPARPQISVLASDNYRLSRVSVTYQVYHDQGEQWLPLGEISLSENGGVAVFTWDTSALADGGYKIRAVAVDAAGNESAPVETSYQLNLTPPQAPEVTAVSGGWKIDLSWTSGNEEDLAGFRVYRSTAPGTGYKLLKETTQTIYTDTPLAPGQSYYYKVEAVDMYRNAAMSMEAVATPLASDPYPPVANAGTEQRAIVGMEVAFDGAQSYDNDKIASYLWNFGDGTTAVMAQPVHTYNREGTYIVTLTVTDPAGNTAADTTKVIVYPPQQVGTIEVKVLDEATGLAIPGASIYVDFPDDTPRHYTADGSGVARIVASAGSYNISAFKDKYLPKEINAVAEQYKTTSATIRLPKGEVVIGELKVRRMTLDEIVDAGIDVYAPENQYVYRFEVHLEFNQTPLPVQYVYVNGQGGIVGDYRPIKFEVPSSGGGSGQPGGLPGKATATAYPKPIPYSGHPEVAPTMAYLVIPQEISWLKEFFEVSLLVKNAADPQFELANSSATLKLPNGLSLAPTRTPQSLTADFGTIAGGETREAKWIIRGDEKGDYTLEADFNGTLMPFVEPVKAVFKTTEPFKVWAGSALHIYAEAEDAAYIGEQYYVQFRITNESDIPVYNLKTSFGDYSEPIPVHEVVIIDPDGNKTVERCDEGSFSGISFMLSSIDAQEFLPSLQPGDLVGIDVLYPGQSIYGTYVTSFNAPGDRDEVYYHLTKAFSTTLGGSNTEVPVTITTIPSHVTKYKVVLVDEGAMWADPVDTNTGAHVIDQEVLKVTGTAPLSFDLDYNSLLLGEGSMGKGWSHNYETRLEKKPDGTLWVYWSPSNFTRFFRKDALDGYTYGTRNDEGIVRVGSRAENAGQEYLPRTQGMEGYVLRKNEDGSYTLQFGNKNKYVFDSAGKLVRLEDRNGKYIEVSRPDDSRLVITEPISGQSLTLGYNGQGLIESVIDKTGRKATFAYNANKCLTEIVDAAGKTTTYTYDSDGRVLTGIDGDGITYFTNTYDAKGRVATQEDAVEGNERTEFDYDDTSEYWRTTVTITDRNGSTRKHTNNRFGQLIRVEDELGNRTTFTYDAKGNRTSVKDPNGNITLYTYDGNGNVLTVSDAEGTQTTMTYDDNGNLLTVENANGSRIVNTYDANNRLTTSTDQNGKTTSYTYNSEGLLEATTVEGMGTLAYTYENGRMATSTDFLGNTTAYGYDQAGRLTTVTDREGKTTAYEYDAADNKTAQTDAEGGRVEYTYDSRHQVISEKDERGNTTRYKYNGNGNRIEVTDPLGGKTAYEYDGEDRLVKTTDAAGNTASTEYDAAGRAAATTDALGNKTAYTYDANGQVLTVTEPGKGVTTRTYYKNGKLHTITDAAGNTTTYHYDAAWRVKGIANAAGKLTAFTYDAADNLLSEKDPLGNTVSYTYDSMGNRLTRTDPKGNVTKYEYNANNKLVSVTDALGNKTEYRYDKEDRLVKTIDANGNATTVTYSAAGKTTAVTDALGNTVTMQYDAASNLAGIKDALGNQAVTATYDALNNPLTVTDALGNITTNKYDSLGRLIEVIDALNRSTKLTYDKMNRIVSAADPLNGISRQEFDADGNLKSITDPNNNEQSFAYDAAGKLISETTAIGSVKTYGYNALNLLEKTKNGRGQETSYRYDDAGRLTSMTDPEGTVSYTYDANGNILTVTDGTGTPTREYDALDRVTKYTDCKGNTVQYTYDSVGNLIALTYPGGKIVRYDYDGANRLTKVTDWNSRVTTYEYDRNGRLTRTSRPNGTSLAQTYDAAGRMLQQKDTDKNGQIINQYDYTYDAAGNVTVEQSSREPGPFGMENAVMTYDRGNRLITYNGQAVEYDADGNMTYGPLKGQMVHFTYDARNRLKTAGDTTYAYDAENNRIAVIEKGLRTEYVNDPHARPGQVLISKDAQGKQTCFVYGLGLIGQEEPDGTYRTYHYDRRGSTTAITDMTGAVTDTFVYAPYGELVGRTGTTRTPFLFNGRDGVMTDSNGLYYMRARYYNPDIKRFINQDVVAGSVLDGRSLNRYAYANGNPVSLVDPFGLSPEISPSSIGHGILDIIGLIPVVGEAFDAVNAVWYAVEGDWFNALASAVSIVPIVGYAGTAVKWGGKAFKATKLGTELFKYGSKAIDYGKAVGKSIAREAGLVREAWKGSGVRKLVTSNAGATRLPGMIAEGIEKKLGRTGTSKVEEALGGAYKDVPKNGGQNHHMPADSVSPYSTRKGPAVRMETADHMDTASWGSSKEAKAYRAKQKKLIDQGKFEEAQQMDVDNVRELFGDKYDNGIQQMIDYTKRLLTKKKR